MALITDLPASTSVASSDVFVKDTGRTTQKITAPNMASGLINQLPSAVPVNKGGTGQIGQTAQVTYTPTIKDGSGTDITTVTVVSAAYKEWGMLKLVGGRFQLNASQTGLAIALPDSFNVPSGGTQVMGLLIHPGGTVSHLRVRTLGLSAYNNGGSEQVYTSGLYAFWAVVLSV